MAFSLTSTQILESVYVPGHTIGHRIAFSDFLNFVLVRKKNDFDEFNVHFIHRKQVPSIDFM